MITKHGSNFSKWICRERDEYTEGTSTALEIGKKCVLREQGWVIQGTFQAEPTRPCRKSMAQDFAL